MDSSKRLQEELAEAFGESVKVDYIDTRIKGSKIHPDIPKLTRMGYSFPFVVVQGKPRLAGGIDYEAVTQMVKEIQASA